MRFWENSNPCTGQSRENCPKDADDQEEGQWAGVEKPGEKYPETRPVRYTGKIIQGILSHGKEDFLSSCQHDNV